MSKKKGVSLANYTPMPNRLIILIMDDDPFAGEKKSQGGIYIPKSAQRRLGEGALVQAKVLKVGKITEEGYEAIKEGTIVLLSPYFSTPIHHDGEATPWQLCGVGDVLVLVTGNETD